MDKIKQLLEKLGSKELADQIIESLEAHELALRENLDKEVKTRLEKAKQVCVEEVNDYKKELAKKAQIFFESRADKIENQIAKQAAIRESAAESKLKDVKSLLEGIDVMANGEAQVDIKALQKKLASLSRTVKALNEAKEAADIKANRAHTIAEKTLKRNRDLERLLSEAQTAKQSAKVVKEQQDVKKGKKTTVKKESKSKTTNVVNEETIKKPKANVIRTGSWSPGNIADQMDL
jgi:hypothetical protein